MNPDGDCVIAVPAISLGVLQYRQLLIQLPDATTAHLLATMYPTVRDA